MKTPRASRLASVTVFKQAGLLPVVPNGTILIFRLTAGSSGGVPKWPKGADCKSAGNAFGGSNPPPSIFHCLFRHPQSGVL